MKWILIIAMCLGMAHAGEVELLTKPIVSGARASADGDSSGAIFSADGTFVLFSSAANDLTEGAFNRHSDVFRKNLSDGSVQLISVGANGASEAGGISADGRFVVFQSDANNLAPGDTNSFTDVYLRDLEAGTNVLITARGIRASRYPQITEDGEWVVFESLAWNLGLADTNNLKDIYAWRRTDGTMRLVSADVNGNSRRVDVGDLSLSANGKVAFSATGPNLVTGGTGTNTMAYVRDLASGTLTWASARMTNYGSYTNSATLKAQISRNGENIYFIAMGTNVQQTPRPLLVGIKLAEIDVVVANFVTNAFAGLEQTHGFSLSDNGNAAAFVLGSNVFWKDTNIFDAVSLDGTPMTSTVNGVSDTPSISHNGRYVAFVSTKANVVAGLEVSGPQLYLRDVTASTNRLVSRRLDGGGSIDLGVGAVVFSPDDSKLIFESNDGGFVVNDTNGRMDIFAFDIATGEISLISKSGSTNAMVVQAGPSSTRSVSGDGRSVAINSHARLAANDTNANSDVYLLDRQAGALKLVTQGTNGFSGSALLSSDGGKMVFESNGRIYRDDLLTDIVTPVLPDSQVGTATLFGMSTNAESIFYMLGTRTYLNGTAFGQQNLVLRSISANGGFATYSSGTTNYLYDFGAAISNAVPGISMISADGSAYVTRFSSSVRVQTLSSNAPVSIAASGSTNLVINANGKFATYELGDPRNIALVDVDNISRSRVITDGNNHSMGAVISADGRFVAFESFASDLVSGDANNTKDVFLYDRLFDRVTLVSRQAGSEGSANGPSFNPMFSADSSTLFFLSAANDLAPDDLNEAVDVFAMEIDASWSIAQRIVTTEEGLRQLVWTGPAVGRFAVEYKTDLSEANWIERLGTISQKNGQYSVGVDTSGPQIFYRIRYIP